MDLAAIVVNYRTAALTAKVVTALLPELAAAGSFSVYVIDNDSRDGSLDALRAHAVEAAWGDRVTVVPARQNGGYGAGINLGVRRARASADPPDYVLILNSDAFADPGCVKAMLDFMMAHPAAGLCGASIHGPDGTRQGSAFRFPTPTSELNDVAKTGFVDWLVANRKMSLPLPQELTEVDWISGTCMMIRRQVFEQIGLFDEGFFLYFEEVDFCRRAGEAGWKSYVLPTATVTHIGAASTGTTDASRRKPGYWFDSRHRYFIKHHGRRYAGLSDLMWMTGFAIREGKRALLRRPGTSPPGLLSDFVRASLRHLTDPRLPGPAPEAAADPGAGTGGLPPAAPIDRRTSAELGAVELLAEDFATYDRNPLEPGLWAVVAHRLGARAQTAQGRAARWAMNLAYQTMFTGIDWVWGIHLPRTVELGRRVRLWHNGCMLLTARSIGNDVHIRHDTTFGPVRGADGDPKNLPVIEDRADIGSGVCVLGGVNVGHDAVVGANSVVIKPVPPRATVLGVPARTVPT